MTACRHAPYCPRRLRDGDRPNGCSTIDLRTCSPKIYSSEIAEPAKPLDLAYCRRCGATVRETGFRIDMSRAPRCSCGSRDIQYPEKRS